MWIKRESLTENDGLPVFVKSFNAEKGLKNCGLKITATGIFDVNINGHEIPDRFMPGWSNYFRHIDLCRYDITERIIPGSKNTLRITVANGWYSGKLGYGNKTNVFGDEKRLFAELTLTYDDGHTDTIVSDELPPIFSTAKRLTRGAADRQEKL